MDKYPFDSVIEDGFSSESTDGTQIMRAIDGTYKTHIMYTNPAFSFTIRHLFSRDDFKELMRFYLINRGKTFLFTSPDELMETEARFSARPSIVRSIGKDMVIAEANLVANGEIRYVD